MNYLVSTIVLLMTTSAFAHTGPFSLCKGMLGANKIEFRAQDNLSELKRGQEIPLYYPLSINGVDVVDYTAKLKSTEMAATPKDECTVARGSALLELTIESKSGKLPLLVELSCEDMVSCY